jgi:hypothetical protein
MLVPIPYVNMRKLRALLIISVIAGTMGCILVRNKAVIDQRLPAKETAKSVAVQPVAFRNPQVDNELIRAELTAAEAAHGLGWFRVQGQPA